MSNNGTLTGIKTLCQRDNSYANSVIQSLVNLENMQKLLNNESLDFINKNTNLLLTKEFYNIMQIILKIGKEPCSDFLIDYFKQYYNNNKSSIVSKNVLCPDPFHFL